MDELKILMSEGNILHKIIWTAVGLIIAILLTKIINQVLYSKIKDNKTYYTTRKKYIIFSQQFL